MIVFLEPIYNTYLSLNNITDNSGQLQYLTIFTFLMSILLYIESIITELKSIPFLHIKIFVCTIITLLLYMLSGAIYEDMPQGYTSSMLRFGSSCVAALLGGIMINQYGKLNTVCKILPWITVLITISVGFYGYSGASMVKEDDFGWNYQNISYCMADCFLFNSFVLFFLKNRNESMPIISHIKTIIITLCIIANAFLCINGGGRGANILLLLSFVLVLYRLILNKDKKNLYFTATISLILVVFFYVSNHLSLWDSDGFYRATHIFEYNTETRESSYSDAIYYWTESPLWGYGIGSIWHTVGFYSHNLFCDWLAEGGVMLFLLMLFITAKSFRNLFYATNINPNYYFAIFYGFTGFVMLLFSGYWFDCEAVWFTIGAAFAYKSEPPNEFYPYSETNHE